MSLKWEYFMVFIVPDADVDALAEMLCKGQGGRAAPSYAPNGALQYGQIPIGVARTNRESSPTLSELAGEDSFGVEDL